jgi:DNA-directed RNA polymerase subunit RPC12/RpoP
MSSSEDRAALRRQVLFGLAIDSTSPTTAYLCVQCGTILGFSGAFDLVAPRDIDCPLCGTFNTVAAA